MAGQPAPNLNLILTTVQALTTAINGMPAANATAIAGPLPGGSEGAAAIVDPFAGNQPLDLLS